MTAIYILHGKGFLQLDRRWECVVGKYAYPTREAAEAAKEDFRRRICEPTDDDLDCFDANRELLIWIDELHIQGIPRLLTAAT